MLNSVVLFSNRERERAFHFSARFAFAPLVLAILLATPFAFATSEHLRIQLPPKPEGVEHLEFREIFEPIGRRGLELTEKVRSLDGKRVRVLGYMVLQEDSHPGAFLLTPVPVQLHEHEYGPADDLPAATILVRVPDMAGEAIARTPGPLLLTGVLSVGKAEELGGRRFLVQLTLDPPEALPGGRP